MNKFSSNAALLVIVATCSVLGLTACAGNPAPATSATGKATVTAPSALVNGGELTYGTNSTFPPFEFKVDGELVGFDVELGEALAGYMGLEVSVLDGDFAGLIPELQGGRIDLINSAMYVTDERAAQVDFIPYLTVGESFVVLAENVASMRDVPKDLSGKTIAVTLGSVGESIMAEFNEELREDGLAEMTVLVLPNNQDALLAVKSGRADGFDVPTPGAAFILSEGKGDFAIANTFALGTKVALAVRKGDKEVKAAVENALKHFVDDGGYAKLLTKYNLPPESSIFN